MSPMYHQGAAFWGVLRKMQLQSILKRLVVVCEIRYQSEKLFCVATLATLGPGIGFT